MSAKENVMEAVPATCALAMGTTARIAHRHGAGNLKNTQAGLEAQSHKKRAQHHPQEHYHNS